MNDNIIDFAEYLDKKEIEGLKNQLLIAACTRALIDVSQEINKIMYYFKETGLKLSEITEVIEKDFDAEGLFIFENLIERQARNMLDISMAIDMSSASYEADVIHSEDVKEQAEEYLRAGNTRADIYLKNFVRTCRQSGD